LAKNSYFRQKRRHLEQKKAFFVICSYSSVNRQKLQIVDIKLIEDFLFQ